jgi:hypothetical protein
MVKTVDTISFICEERSHSAVYATHDAVHSTSMIIVLEHSE